MADTSVNDALIRQQIAHYANHIANIINQNTMTENTWRGLLADFANEIKAIERTQYPQQT